MAAPQFTGGKITRQAQAPPLLERAAYTIREFCAAHRISKSTYYNLRKQLVTPLDALDLSDLWLDPGLGDGITETVRHSIPLGKPRDYFRMHPDRAYRRLVEIYKHKTEDAIEEEYFVFAGGMKGMLEEAAPYTVTVCMYRDGSPRIWPLRLPREGERDNDAWTSARAAAKASLTNWVKLLWEGRSYTTREAKPGYAPDPHNPRQLAFDVPQPDR